MEKRVIASILFLITFILPMFMTACGEDEEVPTIDNVDDNNQPDSTKDNVKNDDNYYVKYEVQIGKQISYAAYTERVLIYKDVDNEKTITTRQHEWEGTYGPFKKGDQVYLQVKSNTAKHSTNARINVSKNKEPFAVKAEERDSRTIMLEYKIDF